MLNCQREGDLGKDSGMLYRHSKECCEVSGRICSETNSVVYIRCFHIDIVGIQYYFCERGPYLKNCSLCENVHEGFGLSWNHSSNKSGQIEDLS